MVADTGNVIGDVGCCPIQIPRQGLVLCITVTHCIMVLMAIGSVVTRSQKQPRFALVADPLQLDVHRHIHKYLNIDINIQSMPEVH